MRFALLATVNPVILLVGGLLATFLVATFLRTANSRQKRAVVLAWLFPGLGHFSLKRGRRGLLLGGIVVVLFVIGLVLADFRNVSPIRHQIWSIAHLFGGLMSGVTALVTWGWNIERDMMFYNHGCLYSAVATLLNILLMIDVYDLAEGAAPADESSTADERPAIRGDAVTIWQNIGLFLPLNLGICIVYSALRRDSSSEIIRQGLRSFAYISFMLALVSVVIHFVMETFLG